MEKPPVPIIEYATPAAEPRNPDEGPALVLGIIAAAMTVVSVYLSALAGMATGFALLGCLFGLLAGGVGWGLARHSRPNTSYTVCSIANTLNWLLFFAILLYLRHRGYL